MAENDTVRAVRVNTVKTVNLWARQLNNELKVAIKLHKAEGELWILVITVGSSLRTTPSTLSHCFHFHLNTEMPNS